MIRLEGDKSLGNEGEVSGFLVTMRVPGQGVYDAIFWMVSDMYVTRMPDMDTV